MRERLANIKASELALASVAVCLLLVAFTYLAFLKPASGRVASWRKQIAEAQEFVKQARTYMGRTPLQVLEAGHLYTFDTLSSLPTELQAAARAVGAVITAIRIGEAVPVQGQKSGAQGAPASAQAEVAQPAGEAKQQQGQQQEQTRLMKVPVTVQAEAAYEPLLNLLRRIEQMPQHISITGLDVSAAPGKKAALSCKAELQVLVYNPEAEPTTTRQATALGPTTPPAGTSAPPAEPFRSTPPEGETVTPAPASETPVEPSLAGPEEPPSVVPPLVGVEPLSGPQAKGRQAPPAEPLFLPKITTPGRPAAGLMVRETLGDGSAWPHLAGTICARGRGVAVIESGGARFTFTEGAELGPGVRLAKVDTGRVVVLRKPMLRGEPQALVARVGEPLRDVTLQAQGSVDQYPQIVCILQGEDGPVAVVREGEQAYTVHPGDVLAGGVRIKRIDKGGVVMEAHGDELRLAVPQLQGPTIGGPATGGGSSRPAPTSPGQP